MIIMNAPFRGNLWRLPNDIPPNAVVKKWPNAVVKKWPNAVVKT